MKIHEGGEGTHQFNPILKVDPTNGIVYILYMGLNSENTTDLYLAYSIDGGQSFKSVKVNETSFEGLPNRKSHDISVVNGVVCPVWLESNDGKIKLMASVITYKQLGID